MIHPPDSVKTLILAFALLLAASSLSGCAPDPQGIESFCSDFRTAVVDNTEDCEAMGQALMSVVKKHRGKHYVGNSSTDDAKAFAGCAQARPLLTPCHSDNDGVKEAMRLLESWE